MNHQVSFFRFLDGVSCSSVAWNSSEWPRLMRVSCRGWPVQAGLLSRNFPSASIPTFKTSCGISDKLVILFLFPKRKFLFFLNFLYEFRILSHMTSICTKNMPISKQWKCYHHYCVFGTLKNNYISSCFKSWSQKKVIRAKVSRNFETITALKIPAYKSFGCFKSKLDRGPTHDYNVSQFTLSTRTSKDCRYRKIRYTNCVTKNALKLFSRCFKI